MTEVREIGISDFFLGYYPDPKNVVVPWFLDQGMQRAYPELPLTAAEWVRLQADPSGVFLDNLTAARLHLKAGDPMPVLTGGGVAPRRHKGLAIPCAGSGGKPALGARRAGAGQLRFLRPDAAVG